VVVASPRQQHREPVLRLRIERPSPYDLFEGGRRPLVSSLFHVLRAA
jgi:hypothetical protein